VESDFSIYQVVLYSVIGIFFVETLFDLRIMQASWRGIQTKTKKRIREEGHLKSSLTTVIVAAERPLDTTTRFVARVPV
jgi:hypothetical protein